MDGIVRARRGPGIGLGIIAVLVALAAINDWAQVVATLVRGAGEPPLLLVLHVVSGSLGVVAVVATWRVRRRAPVLILAWGAALVLMLLCVPVAVSLDDAATRGVWWGAGSTGIAAAVLAWLARRLIARRGATDQG